MGTSSGLGFTSEEELQLSDMILVNFVSVLLLFAGSNAQFQVGKCPTSKECGLKGGECFLDFCPKGLEKIGSCMSNGSRGCVCCRRIIDDEQCPKDRTCNVKGGECQYPKCKKGYREIGRCRSEKPFPCKCCQPIRG